jgi:hypothetical protein
MRMLSRKEEYVQRTFLRIALQSSVVVLEGRARN